MSAPAIEIDHVDLEIGAFALSDISLSVASSEILMLLGRNGAGKSVLLETIAGFHIPAAGRIRVGGRDVTRLPPERRRVGFMVQNFGLFPHMSVADNIRFALRARGDGARDSVGALLERFQLSPLAARLPDGLSPGEKQRVALARALASRPDAFLFDEPFAALDTRTRDSLRDELSGFLRETGRGAIVVTHDEDDVHALADRVAVIHAGVLQQVGTVEDVFARPANLIVADCAGVENLISGPTAERLLAGASNKTLCLRAEHIDVCPAGPHPREANGAIWLDAVVSEIVRLGPVARVTLDCGFPLVAMLPKRQAQGLTRGGPALARIASERVHVVGEG